MSNNTRVPPERHIILPSKQKPSSNIWAIEEEKFCNSISFWATEKIKYSKFMSRKFPEHFAKQTFGDHGVKICCWQLLLHQHHDIHLKVVRWTKFQLNQKIRCWVIQLQSQNWGILSHSEKQRHRETHSEI